MPAIDVRTRTMSAQALTCRTWGHAMQAVPVAARLRTEHHARGQRLIRLVCLRECSRWREIILDMDTGEMIGDRGGYAEPDMYLVQESGTGRLPRTAARVAYFHKLGEPKESRPRRRKDQQ